MFCRVRTEPYPGVTRTRNLCKFCTYDVRIPVPGTCLSSVRPWHNTRGTGLPLQKSPGLGTGTGTTFVYFPGTSVRSVYRTSIAVPGTCVSSVVLYRLVQADRPKCLQSSMSTPFLRPCIFAHVFNVPLPSLLRMFCPPPFFAFWASVFFGIFGS